MPENPTFRCPNCGQQHPVGTTYCPINGLPIEETSPSPQSTSWRDTLSANRAWIIAGAAVIVGILILAVFVTLTVLGGRSNKLPTAPTLAIILPSLMPGQNTPAPSPNQVVITPTLSIIATPDSSPWQACSDAVYLSRIHVGNTVEVSSDPPLANRVRQDASLDSEVIGYIKPGETAVVIDGPGCNNQWVWWKVRASAGFEGWTAEGDGRFTGLCPFLLRKGVRMDSPLYINLENDPAADS